MMDFAKNAFGFILFKVYVASWICRFVSFAKFGKLSATIYLNTLSALLSFSLISEAPMIWMLKLFVIFPQVF